MNENQDAKRRRPYVKPEAIQVPLRPEEAVLGSCKTVSGALGGPGNSDCRTPSMCFSEGS